MTATPNIPDGISFAALQKLAESAPEQNEIKLWGGKTQDQVIEIANKHVKESMQECEDPMVHKTMILMMLKALIDWHRYCAQEGLEKGSVEEAALLIEDAGELRAAAKIIRNMDVSAYDFDVTDQA